MASEVETRRPYEQALAEINVQSELSKGSNFEIMANVADRILTAQSFEEIDAAVESGPDGIETLEGVIFRFIGGSLRWSDSAEQFKQGGTGKYAIFQVVDHKNNQHLVSTGATNCVFELKAYQNLGVFDNEGEIYPREFTVKSRPTPNGTLYRIVSA